MEAGEKTNVSAVREKAEILAEKLNMHLKLTPLRHPQKRIPARAAEETI
jgi:hypothetical protein